MSEKTYDVSADWSKRAFIDDAKYREMYASSVKDPNAFWAEQGKRIGWIKPFHKVENVSFAPGSTLTRITGADKAEASCYHHQHVDRLGEGLTVTARAADGTVEAVEFYT